MDTEKEFDIVRKHIENGEYDMVRHRIGALADRTGDLSTLIKCASLLKAVDDEEGCRDIMGTIAGKDIADGNERLTAAMSLRGLGGPEDAYRMIKNDGPSDPVSREKARCLLMMGRGKEALPEIRAIAEPTEDDMILLCGALCSAGEYDEACDTAARLAAGNATYDVLVNLCSVLILSGKNKEAVSTARKYLKEEKKDADSLALAAYVMRINGKTTAAAAYAHKALSIDHMHKGALETMALCLIEKKKFPEAKMCAGAINERSPGDPAAIRILDMCRQASR
ncbi:MAG: hypothetical protein FWG58_02025 [Methanomassiliicoccaceae archaeon]|nr:hypothetical protein [Methanomassiliicoccaceae archaeon]